MHNGLLSSSNYVCKYLSFKFKTAEVAYHFLDIFMLFGVPSTLQLDNSREFTRKIINNLKKLLKAFVAVPLTKPEKWEKSQPGY